MRLSSLLVLRRKRDTETENISISDMIPVILYKVNVANRFHTYLLVL